LFLLCGFLTVLGALVFAAIVFLTIDPLKLETPAPRPGAHWIVHLEVWRAVLVLSVVAVAVSVLFVAARTLRRRSVNDLKTGGRERLVLGALSCVLYLGLLALIGEMISGDYDGSDSPELTISIICVGLMLCAGSVMTDRLKGTGSLHSRLHARPLGQKSYRKALIALVPLCALVAAASFANIQGAATAMDQVPSGNLPAALVAGLTSVSAPSAFPTSLLVRLSGGFGWASVGFATFSASNPNLPVSTDSPSCPSRDCVIAGVGNGGEQVLGFVQGSSVTWRGHSLSGGYPLVTPLACASDLDCIALNENFGFTVTADGGRLWSDLRLPKNIQSSVPSQFAMPVACAPAGPCFALAVRELSPAARRRCHCQSVAVFLRVGGDHDVKVQAIPGLNLDLWTLTCPTSLVCLAAGADQAHPSLIARTDDAGRSWKVVDLPTGIPTLDQVDCPDARRCVAVGDTGWPYGNAPVRALILTSNDGGMTWRSWRGAQRGTVLTSVACMASGACIASGETISPGSSDGVLPAGAAFVVSTLRIGLPWTRVPVPRGRFATTGAACSTLGCVITGEEFEPGPADDFIDGMNWNGSPAATGVVLRWAPVVGLRLLSTPPLPQGVAQPVVDIP
jgi:hypothetical protein